MRSYEVIQLGLDESAKLTEHPITLDAPDTGVVEPIDGTFPLKFYDILDGINETPKIIKDPQTGKEFEAILVNPDQKHKGVTVSIGTYSSSMSTNPGNAAEEAMRAIFADGTRLYIAPFGNGYSESLTDGELKRFAWTGDLLLSAFGTMESLARALETKQKEDDFEIKRFSTDSFGGYIATGLAPYMDSDQIDSMFMKSKPGVSGFSLGNLAVRMLGVENTRNAWNYKFGNSTDPWKITPAMMEFVKSHIPSLYGPDSKDFVRQGSKKQLIAYGKGMSKVSRLDDLKFTVSRNPNIALTYDFPTKDLLYKRKSDIAHYIGEVLELANKTPEFYRSEGGHGLHATQPQLRATLEKHAFRPR